MSRRAPAESLEKKNAGLGLAESGGSGQAGFGAQMLKYIINVEFRPGSIAGSRASWPAAAVSARSIAIYAPLKR
jgi:hypothetical protein